MAVTHKRLEVGDGCFILDSNDHGTFVSRVGHKYCLEVNGRLEKFDRKDFKKLRKSS